MIYIETQGGLANRMRVISSALALQNGIGKQVQCYWVPKAELNARFEELFLSIDVLQIMDKVPFKYRFLKSSFHDNPIKYFIANGINFMSDINLVLKDKDVVDVIWSQKMNLITLTESKKQLYLKTCSNFYGGSIKSEFFIPVPAIQSIIMEKTSTFTNPVIGIHIRRTDNKKSILYSPTELFIQKIDQQLGAEPNTCFYLATDDLQEEKLLKNRYGSRIITHQKVLDRSSLKGIRDAMVDLYSLSATDAIWGSYWSSFSDMAATIGNKKKEIVKLENPI
jgi:hypothetical protein